MTEVARTLSELERDWIACGRDLARLPALAAAALRGLDLTDFDPLDAAEYAIVDPALPPQLAVPFGDAQVTIARGEHLLAQLVYWLDGTTAIHQHGFAGAFRVVTGASLHSTYQFDARLSVDAHFALGRLTRKHQEFLEPGGVREIGAGGALIHNLNHLEYPSVTLVFRTPFLTELTPQWSYYAPGIAIDPYAEVADQRERRRLLEVCWQVEPARARRVARALVDGGLGGSWQLLATAMLYGSERELAQCTALVKRRHGSNGRLLANGLERLQVRTRLHALRRRVRSREHRTFLALLADGGDRDTIVHAIKVLHPRQSETALIERWLLELAAPLQLSLDRRSARVLRRAVEGVSVASIVRELKSRQFTADTTRRLIAAFRKSPLFSPLVTGDAGGAELP